MDVSCPACAARYTADDEKLRGKTARMRCRSCETTWMVSGPGATPAPHFRIESDASSKRAAVVRKGAEREKRDLFAERELDEGSVKQTVLPAPSFGFTGGVAARNENSVLFRVDQLTAAARVPTPAPAHSPAPAGASTAPGLGTDDEGVIDLKALASAPPRKVGLPVAPLFAEPPAVSLDVNESARQGGTKPASKIRLIGGIAAGATFLLLAGFGISLAFKGEEPVQHAAAMVVEQPAAGPLAAGATALAAAPESPKVDPAAAPVASADDSTDTQEQAEQPSGKKGKKGKGKGKGKGRAAKGGATTNKSPAPAAKPPKPADPCGCKGDFNCILACTAKRGR